MRIAHFVQRYPPALGGSEAYFARLSRHLAATGDQVSVFTTTANDLEAFWSPRGRCFPSGVQHEDGVEVRRYPLCRLPGQRNLLRALSLVPHRAWQLLTVSCNPLAWGMWRDAGRREQPFDLVHATAFPYGWPLYCGLRLARTLRIPYLLTPFVHLGDPDDPRDRTRRAFTSPAMLSLLSAAERVFVQTEGEYRAMQDRGVPTEKLVLQGMGVDWAGCTGGERSRARHEWGMAEQEIVVGHLANNSVEKGSVDLLKAAALAWRADRRFRVVLAGPEMPNFRSFWSGFEPKAGVVRLGPLDERQKRDFFSGIDLFALPSRTDSFGMVLLEAWANGAPNIGYRAGGIADVIRDGQDGLLVRCGDVGGLAEGIVRLVEDAPLRRRLGEAGGDRLDTEFRWEYKLALVQRVYRQVCARET